jgi:PleD family two-component response regulator
VLVKKADKALYFSKANGKNQVTAYRDINSSRKKQKK